MSNRSPEHLLYQRPEGFTFQRPERRDPHDVSITLISSYRIHDGKPTIDRILLQHYGTSFQPIATCTFTLKTSQDGESTDRINEAMLQSFECVGATIYPLQTEELFTLCVGSLRRTLLATASMDPSAAFQVTVSPKLLRTNQQILPLVVEIAVADRSSFIIGPRELKKMEEIQTNMNLQVQMGHCMSMTTLPPEPPLPANDYSVLLAVPTISGKYTLRGSETNAYLVGSSPETMGRLLTYEWSTVSGKEMVIGRVDMFGLEPAEGLNLILATVHALSQPEAEFDSFSFSPAFFATLGDTKVASLLKSSAGVIDRQLRDAAFEWATNNKVVLDCKLGL